MLAVDVRGLVATEVDRQCRGAPLRLVGTFRAIATWQDAADKNEMALSLARELDDPWLEAGVLNN